MTDHEDHENQRRTPPEVVVRMLRAGHVPGKVAGYSGSIIDRANRMNARAGPNGIDPQSGAGPPLSVPDMGNDMGDPGKILESIANAKTGRCR